LKTLLNGSGAEAAARPQLEIYTDKVRARHGATTGKLDEQMLFYLLSRGIDRPQAQALLQWAFIEDAVSQVELAPLRQEIEQLIAAQLNEVSALDGLVART
jgi:Fe-S cluster assembly protein SufD